MEFLLENILNLIGFIIGIIIGVFAYVGYKNTGSPVLFRLTIAFIAIGIGFGTIWMGYVIDDIYLQEGKINRGLQALGLGIQTIGYFFIAFSHTIKSFFPKSRYFRSVGILPLFALSAMNIEHIIRSFSFILLVYGAIETFVSFLEGKQKLAMLKPVMNNLQILNREELLIKEPALSEAQSKLFGGIYCPSDESGSCRDFTLSLVDICKKKGAKFHFNTTIQNIENDPSNIKNIITNKGDFQGDKYVLACASYSPIIAKMVGDYLPIYPVKGYSITVPITNPEKVPIHSGIDEDNMTAFSLMGNFLRFTSVAEISGYDTKHMPADFTEIINIAESLFSQAYL